MSTTSCDEAQRLAALHALSILDTPEEAHFEAVCRTARRLFGIETAVVSLIDADRQWLKTACALVPREVPRSTTFCDHTIRGDAVFVVQDATKDPRFASGEMVAGPPHIRFYAGAPLVLRSGIRVGAFCLIDTVARAFSEEDAEALRDLADIVVAHLLLAESNATSRLDALASEARERVIKESEVAVARSEARYRGLTEALPLLVWATRMSDGAATFSNACFHAYCGPIGVEREARRAMVHRDDRPALDAAWAAACASGTTMQGDARLRRHDGVFRWHKVVMIPIPLADGSEPSEWLGTALDIDDIVTARKGLEETGALLRIALESADAGAWQWDMETGDAILSAEAVRIYGLPGEGPISITSAQWTEFLHPDDRIPTWDALRHAVETRTGYRADYRVVCGPTERWICTSGRVLYGADRRPHGIVGLHFDVTKRKETEAALEAARAIAEAAQSEAERASEAKSEFLAAMSHEIRTPLNGILGYADLLLDGRDHSDEDRHRLELIQGSGSALLSVVNDILDFSKIEAGQLELDPIVFPLHGLVDNTVSIVAGSILKRSLKVGCEFDPALPSFVTGDEGRLRQVLLNLLNNAVKFTHTGSVTLRVRHEGSVSLAGGETADAMRFEVADTGIGIAPSQRDRLFKRFSQVDGSISRRFGGSGLGLAICRHLVTMMGGEIGVESREGVGSTFWFTLTLPRCEALPALAVELPLPETATPAANEPAGNRRIRLLLVEDVKINQELARAVLEVNGYHVDVVGDGVDALATVQATAGRADAYDLVLMDVQMPGMDGLTATRRIRALPFPARDVPVVAMTANVLPGQIEDLHEAGMDDHVGKPFKRAELYATIERWVGRKRGVGLSDAAIDRQVFSSVQEQMGAERVRSLLAMLESELGARFATGEADESERLQAAEPVALDRARLAQDAHAMVSAAGTLGFVGIARLCREIEAACRAGGELGPLIARLAVLREDTIREIRVLRAA